MDKDKKALTIQRIEKRAEVVPIPDLRFEQAFIKRIRSRAKAFAAARGRPYDPTAPIPWPVIVGSILREQFCMPFLQGFAFAAFRLAVLPWLRATFGLGKRAGETVSRGAKGVANTAKGVAGVFTSTGFETD